MTIVKRDVNKILGVDTPAHDWYRFVLSFPPHLVREYCERFGVTPSTRVLDPFCGTGTVLVECKKLGIPSVGVEAHPLSAFASAVKVDWSPEPDGLLEHASRVASSAGEMLNSEGHRLRDLPAEAKQLLLTGSIGDLALHKSLLLLECLDKSSDDHYRNHERLGLAWSVVHDSSNLQFGPEVGVEPLSRRKRDAPVAVAIWVCRVG